MRWRMKCFGISVGVIALIWAMIMVTKFSCSTTLDSDLIEVGRIPSPDNRVDAIVVENRGYDVKEGFMVYIEPIGQQISNHEAFTLNADKVHGLSLRWTKPTLLEIHYRKMRTFGYYNIWTDEGFRPFMRTIEIKLIKDGDEELDIYHD